jgi:phosphoribosyl isomerase A
VPSHLELLPAVDVAGGQAVQLMQGVAGSEKRFGDPVAAALRWQESGAEWIHLVDLDAAFGRGHNRELLASIVGRVDVRVELSGGIRDDESLAAAMATGCRRVNIGTAALEQPEWCAAAIAEWGDRVAVGLDVRGRTLAARGWTRDGGDLYDVLARLDSQGCARYVVTDVNKDGMLQGPNLQLLRDVCAATDRPVVASGGITELSDLDALAGLVDQGVEGAIIGTALYEQRFTLEEALALVAAGSTGSADSAGSAGSAGSVGSAPTSSRSGRKRAVLHRASATATAAASVKCSQTGSRTAARPEPAAAPTMLPTLHSAWNRGIRARPRLCSTWWAWMFIETSQAPQNSPIPNSTSPSAGASGANAAPITTGEATTAQTVVTARLPHRRQARPVSGIDTSEPAAIESSASPSTAGPTPSRSRTSGIRVAQEAYSRPFAAKTT